MAQAAPEIESETVLSQTLTYYGETVDWLVHHHSRYAEVTTHDLDADLRVNAVWKLGGESLALTGPLVRLLIDGYTGQTWPTMRAIHESNRLLVAVTDPQEERIVRRWLADKEVKQAEARQAEERGAKRIAEEMRKAGLDTDVDSIGALARTIYAGMSKAVHHRRSFVDEGVDPEQRTMIYGPDPRLDRRIEYTVYAGSLVQEVLLEVGDSLCFLWGRESDFYGVHLTPMIEQMATVLDALNFVHATGRLGSPTE